MQARRRGPDNLIPARHQVRQDVRRTGARDILSQQLMPAKRWEELPLPDSSEMMAAGEGFLIRTPRKGTSGPPCPGHTYTGLGIHSVMFSRRAARFSRRSA